MLIDNNNNNTNTTITNNNNNNNNNNKNKIIILIIIIIRIYGPTSIHKNNATNDKFYRKVVFLMYTDMVNFRHQAEQELQN